MPYLTAETIRTLREQKHCTQRQLACQLGVTDKAVSKWETGRGLPDIALVEPLAAALGVSVAELLAGQPIVNANRAANMLRTRFYVCPVCGNVITSAGEAALSCCGVTLTPLEPEEANDAHRLQLDISDGEVLASLDHPMTKLHYVSFIAYVTTDRVYLHKLYPEQPAQARFALAGSGTLYAYCNIHGLVAAQVKPARTRVKSLLV